jgi:hypothetical protein
VEQGQWYNSGYTEGVKTAVSMPDDLFRMAEATARRLHVSRSELYAKAIAEYLKLQQGMQSHIFAASGETGFRIASRPTEVSRKGCLVEDERDSARRDLVGGFGGPCATLT